jgi:hypothetical protein
MGSNNGCSASGDAVALLVGLGERCADRQGSKRLDGSNLLPSLSV